VLTTTRSNRPLSRAAAMVYEMIGLLAKGLMFLLGIRLEPPRAGIIAMLVPAMIGVPTGSVTMGN
jgi:hypothetical protein